MHFRQQNREDYSAEGEWHARKHGGPKRRVWRKIHLGIDEETLEVRAVEITGSHIGDAPVLPDLLSQIPVMKRSVRSLCLQFQSCHSARFPFPYAQLLSFFLFVNQAGISEHSK